MPCLIALGHRIRANTCQDANSVFVLCKDETDRTSRSKNKPKEGEGSSLFHAGMLHLAL